MARRGIDFGARTVFARHSSVAIRDARGALSVFFDDFCAFALNAFESIRADIGFGIWHACAIFFDDGRANAVVALRQIEANTVFACAIPAFGDGDCTFSFVTNQSVRLAIVVGFAIGAEGTGGDACVIDALEIAATFGVVFAFGRIA